MNIQQMTLREKVGQLFILGVDGQQISPDIIHLLKTYHVGGIYLGEDNVKHPKQVHTFTQKMQNYSKANHPLFIAMKQNGGVLNTIKEHVTPGLTPQDLGKMHNRVYTKRLATYIGDELHAMGVNINLGPMLHHKKDDVNSYSEQLDVVAKQGRATIEGFQKAKILAAAAQFPQADELQLDVPIYKTALHPFAYVIEHGCQAILTVNTAKTSDILRNDLQFHGLIIQDCISAGIHDSDTVIESIQAGANMILLKDSNHKQMEIMEAVIEAVQTGLISETMLDATLKQVGMVKEQMISKDIAAYDREAFAPKRNIAFVRRLEKMTAND